MDLDNISFGDRVAENESDKLSNYFISTQQWHSLYSGKSDVIFGAKGSGKSALYTLLLKRNKEFFDKNTILVSVERPTGKTVFSDINDEPPTAENEFVTLWKVYFIQLIINWLIENGRCHGIAREIADKLVTAGLIEEKNTLRRLVNMAKSFAKKLTDVQSLEGGATLEGGVTGKITFRTPDGQMKRDGYSSLDELLEQLNDFLTEEKLTFWLLCDRLDVAFDQSINLEKNALRALFKVYRDLEEFDCIFLKIFLRDDIWKRITDDGFREASHITRTNTIEWSSKNLMNLIVMRVLENKELVKALGVDANEIKSDHQKQIDFYYTLFPKQVDVGERQSDTFDWVLSRVRDGLGKVAPRELIHFYNEMLLQEQREKDISNNKIEPPNIVSRAAIKNSTLEVSKVRLEQTIFAEYPDLKDSILLLENQKAEHSISSISAVWQKNEQETIEIATKLSEIGFFDLRSFKNDSLLKIPFIYRPYLKIVQGKAF